MLCLRTESGTWAFCNIQPPAHRLIRRGLSIVLNVWACKATSHVAWHQLNSTHYTLSTLAHPLGEAAQLAVLVADDVVQRLQSCNRDTVLAPVQSSKYPLEAEQSTGIDDVRALHLL